MEIELKDGTVLDAPDGLSPDQIKSLVVNYTRSNWSAGEQINNAVNQVGTGAYKGLAGVAALPRTLSDLAADPSQTPRHPVAGRGIPGAERYVQQTIDPTKQNPGQSLPSADDLLRMLQSGTGKGAAFLGMPKLAFEQAPAETTGDKYLQAGGMGASGVFLPGGAAPNFVGGVAGGVGSEGAGQLTEGTAAEPYARIAGAIIPALMGSYGANKLAASNVEQLISRATKDATPEQWAAATQLQADAARSGAPITAAEAMAQVQGGNRTLMSIQRTTEQMPQTERQMSQFMAQRPEGNQAALGGQLDTITPQSAAPFEVGPRVQGAAQGAVGDVRQQINKLTEDWYQWGENMQIPPAEFASVSESPVFQHYLEQMRADPLYYRLKDMPENSVAVVNQVKKLMDESGANYATYGTGQTSPQKSMLLEQEQKPMVAAAKQASPLYEAALEKQAELRQSQLEPLKRGATGQLADTADWQAQAKIILSDTPGSEKEVAAAVKNVIAKDPTAVPELLRMKLEDTFNKSLSNSKGTMEQFRGANFASVLEKNPQVLKSLEATIKALPNGETQWMGMRRLLDVFEAQGQRLLPGSPTSFNQQLAGTLGENLGKGVKSLGTDMWANWNVERRSKELARILTAPEGVALLRRLAVEGPNTAKAQQLVQGFYQGGQAGRSLEKTP